MKLKSFLFSTAKKTNENKQQYKEPLLLPEISSPPKPRFSDIEDAIEYAGETYEEFPTNEPLENFDIEYLGLLSPKDFEQYADVRSWIESFDEDEDMSSFRGEDWFSRIEKFREEDKIPPVIIVQGQNFEDVADGRGRITYATSRNIPLHTYVLKHKN